MYQVESIFDQYRFSSDHTHTDRLKQEHPQTSANANLWKMPYVCWHVAMSKNPSITY